MQACHLRSSRVEACILLTYTQRRVAHMTAYRVENVTKALLYYIRMWQRPDAVLEYQSFLYLHDQGRNRILTRYYRGPFCMQRYPAEQCAVHKHGPAMNSNDIYPTGQLSLLHIQNPTKSGKEIPASCLHQSQVPVTVALMKG